MKRHLLTGQTVATGICILSLVGFLFSPLAIKAQTWSITFDGVGTFSSPRVTDLNGDGVGDVIVGAGGAKSFNGAIRLLSHSTGETGACSGE